MCSGFLGYTVLGGPPPISDVDSASDAATKGLKNGDYILEIQGAQVTKAADVEAGVKKAKDAGRKAVLLRVKSGETVRFVDGTEAHKVRVTLKDGDVKTIFLDPDYFLERSPATSRWMCGGRLPIGLS